MKDQISLGNWTIPMLHGDRLCCFECDPMATYVWSVCRNGRFHDFSTYAEAEMCIKRNRRSWCANY